MSKPCWLGVDLGTSGCRAVAIDDRAALIAEASTPLAAPRRTPDGGSEQDPEDWWRGLTEVLSRLAPALTGYRPAALGLDATSTTLLLADRQGRPLGPASMYDDRRAQETAERLAASVPPESPARGAASSLSKAMFLRERCTAPARAHVLHQADWIIGRLSGRFDVSDWNNSLRLGFDPATESWADWLQQVPLGGLVLPRVVRPGTPVGGLTPEAAAATGLPSGLPVCAGTTDSTAAALAAGIGAPGDGVSVLGSTLVVKVATRVPVNDPAHGVYSHRLGDLWLAGGASNTGGAVLRHFFSDRRIEQLSQCLRPDLPSGLDYYPLLRPGERFPIADPLLAPRVAPRPADDAVFLQGLLEGIAAIEARSSRLLGRLGAPPVQRIRSIGGGASNTAWQAIRARVCGVPVERAPHQQAAYGASLLAARATGGPATQI